MTTNLLNLNYFICRFSVLIFLSAVPFLHAQKRIDSILQAAKIQHGDALVSTLNELSWEYKNSIPDSALVYGKRALKVALQNKLENGVADSYNSIASAFQATAKFDSALVYQRKSFDINQALGDSLRMADNFNNLGIINDEKGAYERALQNYFKALTAYEKYPDNETNVAMVLVNIGIVYKKQKAYTSTLDYYQRALKIYEETDNKVGQVITKSNIGSLMLQLEQYKDAISYASNAAIEYKALGYSRYVPYMQSNIAIAKDSLKLHREANEFYTKAITQFRADNNLYELNSALIGIGQNQLYQKEYSKAITFFKEALSIATDNDFKEFEVRVYDKLAIAYARVKNFSKAYAYKTLFTNSNDSLFETEKTKSIFELETKYQTELKEKEILEQRARLAETKIEVNRKNNLIYGSLGLASLLGLLGFLFYNQQKLKNRQLKKEGELKQALALIETQNKLQEQRLRISRDLHDNIGSQLTFVTSSVDNLKYGLKDADAKITNKLGNISAFTTQTIYELRDTIWAMNKTEISFEDLQVRISNFIDNAGTAAENVAFDFNVSESIPKEKTFPSVVGMNIYRIIQEAINNALKYADAANISVGIKQDDEGKEVIIITDDGKGFDVSNAALGNGLSNMKKRARDIEGAITIRSEEAKSTTIVLNL